MASKILFLLTITWLASLAHSAVITCNWYYVDTCSYDKMNITPVTSPYDDIQIYGKPADFIHTEPASVHINAQFVQYVPLKLFTVFPNLEELRIRNSFTSNLTTNSFVNCPKLKLITIESTKVFHIPAGVAQTCTNLLSLIIRDRVQTIDKDAFIGLAKLELLQMYQNQITCIHPDLLQHTPALKNVFFSNNQVGYLDRNLLRNLPNLVQFNIANNSLTYVPLLNLAGTAVSNGLTMNFILNPIYAINPIFCFIFSTRPTTVVDNFQIPCVPASNPRFQFNAATCLNSLTTLKGCYLNWALSSRSTTCVKSVSAPAPIVPPQGCDLNSLWSQIIDNLSY